MNKNGKFVKKNYLSTSEYFILEFVIYRKKKIRANFEPCCQYHSNIWIEPPT